jgi:membrane protein involved in colicin uptake
MAQRNPLNERYQGDGPGGQTRKSAARAKPVTQAASSVHIKKKPQTEAEKRAARKARAKEEERRAAERARKKAEKAEAEGASAQDDAEKPAAKADAKPAAKANAKPAAKTDTPPQGFLGKLLAPPPNMPETEEYRKWRKLYWILLAIGIVFVAASFATQSLVPQNQTLVMITLGCAYAPIIGAFIVDFRKVRPLVRTHQRQASTNKSPKQLKHEQEARERAEAMEAARKAARGAKKRQRRKKPSDTIVPGDEQ